MDTPICDFVKKYAKSSAVRLHMPGHKGKGFLGTESMDITEIGGADVLYSPCGIIAKSQQNASTLFGTARTVYSTEGSSLCIRAMLRLALEGKTGDSKKPWILAARNVHKAFLSACALLDVDVEWIYPDESDGVLCCRVTAQRVGNAINVRGEKPIAVYLTSPDYLGNTCDIAEIAAVCRKYGILLLVDNAHGAYRRFLDADRHPISLGADMCCDSAHKTLPVLTGGAYLHISKCAPQQIVDSATAAMELFASTSPSYLIMQSLDRANAYLDGDYRERLSKLAARVDEIKERLCERGMRFVGDEPIKLTVSPKSYGYTGEELAEYLLSNDVVCEFADRDFCVMMLTPETDASDIDRLESALLALERREAIVESNPTLGAAQRAMSIREAMLSPSKEVDVEDAEGMILGQPSVACPPAVPVVMCGEIIDSDAIKCFKYYNIKRVRVVK